MLLCLLPIVIVASGSLPEIDEVLTSADVQLLQATLSVETKPADTTEGKVKDGILQIEEDVTNLQAMNSTIPHLSHDNVEPKMILYPGSNEVDELEGLVALEVGTASAEQEYTPFALRLERAVRDPSVMQRLVADLGGSSSHTVEGLQAGLVLLQQSRTGHGNLSLLQPQSLRATKNYAENDASTAVNEHVMFDQNYAENVAQTAVNEHVFFDHILSGLAEGSGDILAKAIKGEVIDEKDILSVALPALAGIIGIANPVLGVAATFGVGLIGGLLGDEGPDFGSILEDFGEEMMKEVKGMIDQSLLNQKLAEIESELQDLSAEMLWVPQMLESTDAAQAKVAYFLMFQTHLASMKSRLFKGSCIREAMKHCSSADCPTYPERATADHSSYIHNAHVWGFQGHAVCENLAKTGVPAILGLGLSFMHLDAMEKVWEHDQHLRPAMADRMKMQLFEYGKTMAAYMGAMIRHRAKGYSKFKPMFKHWLEGMMFRSPGASLFDGCVDDYKGDMLSLSSANYPCRRRRAPPPQYVISATSYPWHSPTDSCPSGYVPVPCAECHTAATSLKNRGEKIKWKTWLNTYKACGRYSSSEYFYDNAVYCGTLTIPPRHHDPNGVYYPICKMAQSLVQMENAQLEEHE